jgi:hypothetical protein
MSKRDDYRLGSIWLVQFDLDFGEDGSGDRDSGLSCFG